MKDKVSELREILNKKKVMNTKKQHEHDPVDPAEPHLNDLDADTSVPVETTQDPAKDDPQTEAEIPEPGTLEQKIRDLENANRTQKEMYLRKVADFDNFKKRLIKEQDEFNKYASEKIIMELLPVIDSLEMTLSHCENPKDPIAQGVGLVLKQFLQSLEKHGVKQISGEKETFDPNFQEAIGTEKSEDLGSNKVVSVHRKGYTLNGKVLRAAMVTVSE